MQAINKNIKTQVAQAMAEKYIWWQTPAEAATWPERVIAQVMNIGDFDDAKYLIESMGGEALIELVDNAYDEAFDMLENLGYGMFNVLDGVLKRTGRIRGDYSNILAIPLSNFPVEI